MVGYAFSRGKDYFYCSKCLVVYEDREWAEKCEKWCRENNSCNIEITSHSIKKTLGDLLDGKENES